MQMPASYDAWKLSAPEYADREEVTLEYRVRVIHNDGTESMVTGKVYPYADDTKLAKFSDDTDDWTLVDFLISEGANIPDEDEADYKVELFNY